MLNNLKVSLFLALHGLARGNRGSFILTVAIIGMIFVNMIILPSIITGEIHLFEKQTIDYYVADVTLEPKMTDTETGYISDVDFLLNKVNHIPGVLRASAHYGVSGVLKNRGIRLGEEIIAIKPRDEAMVTAVSTRMKEGDYLSEGDTGEVIIGTLLAGHKDESEDLLPSLGGVRVGDSITIEYNNGVVKNYRIKGIFETGSTDVDHQIFVTWDDIESVTGGTVDNATIVLVRADPGIQPAEVKQSLLRYGVQEKVKTWRELLGKAYGREVQSYGIINQITMAVSLVIAVVVIFIIIMIKTINSRRQIGILKALGIPKSVITNDYLFQVMILTLIGIAVGLLILGALSAYFSVYPMKFPEGDVVPYITPADLIVNATGLFVASCLFGYVPAWRIASEEILTAMRG